MTLYVCCIVHCALCATDFFLAFLGSGATKEQLSNALYNITSGSRIWLDPYLILILLVKADFFSSIDFNMYELTTSDSKRAARAKIMNIDLIIMKIGPEMRQDILSC